MGAWPGEAPDVLLVTTNGVFRGGALELAAHNAVRAVYDLAGGIVWTRAGDGLELHWRATGSPSSQALPIGGPEGLEGGLHQVANIDGTPAIVATRRISPEHQEPEEFLELYELSAEAPLIDQVIQTGGIEWGAQAVSYAAGVFLVTEINHSCGRLYLIDASGEEIDEPALPEPPCQVHFEVPFLHGRLSPDGSLIAYVAQTFEFDDELNQPVVVSSHLEVVDRAAGEEVLREQVTDEPTEVVASMDFDGEWLVWARVPPGGEPALAPAGSEVLGRHLVGARFQAEMEGVRSVWLPRAPLGP